MTFVVCNSKDEDEQVELVIKQEGSDVVIDFVCTGQVAACAWIRFSFSPEHQGRIVMIGSRHPAGAIHPSTIITGVRPTGRTRKL